MEILLDDILREALNTAPAVKPEVKLADRKYGSKPLKFEVHDKDSNIKKIIVEYINTQDLYYADLVDYCVKYIFNGNFDAGSHKAYNIIDSLRLPRGIKDTSIDILLDFLGLDLGLMKR